ncbi:MAG: class I tRNA ligase family protein, partial [Nocardioides sp.]
QVDGYTGAEERFVAGVRDFMERLYLTGKLVLRTMLFPYSPATQQYLVDGYVRGNCPLCLASGCAGLCESCGNPIAPGDLIDPVSTMNPQDPVELREAKVFVLPMEPYRERLREHFAAGSTSLRPHMVQAIEEMLSRPLPDYPVTYPISWGIPAPFTEVPGQAINPNAEPAAWSIYCAALSAERRGIPLAADDQLWLAGAGTKVVYFLGFDNTYPFAIAAVAMLMATDGRYVLPEDFVTNEFYELNNAKFSTSRGHVVWGRDLVAEVPRDLVRFFLAATSPENQRTDFSRDALTRVTSSRLVEPWNRVAEQANRFVGRGSLPVSERSRDAAARIVHRFAACYELDCFSLTRAAEALSEQLARLASWVVRPGEEGDFCHEVEVVLRCAGPILIDLIADASVSTRIPADSVATTITPVVLPLLTESVR